jgi:hypothetical protein
MEGTCDATVLDDAAALAQDDDVAITHMRCAGMAERSSAVASSNSQRGVTVVFAAPNGASQQALLPQGVATHAALLDFVWRAFAQTKQVRMREQARISQNGYECIQGQT